jgi:hypothetical protein
MKCVGSYGALSGVSNIYDCHVFLQNFDQKSFICYYISVVPLINSRVKFYTGILRVNERQQLANCYQVLGEIWPLYLDH